MPGTMRALITHEWGDPDELRLEVVPRPEVAEGELLIRVEAARGSTPSTGRPAVMVA